MKTFIVGLAISTLLFFAPHASAKNSYSAKQCTAWFNKVDRNNDGSIGTTENADGYLARVTLGSESESSSSGSFIMSRSFFVTECKIGSLGKPEL